MAGLGTGAGAPVVKVYHEKSMILPDVSRVLACLYEKNVEFETVKDSYKDILRLQSTRSVPVPFYDGPTFLQESRAICRYIAETYEQHGYPFLLGKDVLERASIEQWLRHEEHAFDPPSRALFCHLAFPLLDEDMSDIDREKRKLEEVLEVYEQRLGESEFLAGNKFTLADLVHLPNTHHIVTSEKFAYLYDSRKNVQRWWNTISARDSWQQVVRDMQSVEEQNQIDELEQQQQLEEQWQWETESPPTSGRRILRIDPRQQTGTESRTVLVPPPSGGAISSSFFTVQQEQQPLPSETSSHGETSPNNRKGSNFFTTTDKTSAPSKQITPTTQKPPSSVESTTSNFFTPATPRSNTKMSQTTDTDKSTQKSPSSVQNTASSFFAPPSTTKMPQRTSTDKSASKDASSPTRPSQGSSKEAPDKLHLSDFYKASSHTDETSITKPTPKEASKTSDRISGPRRTSEVVGPDQAASAKTPSGVDGPASATTRELPPGSQNTPQQSKAPPTNLKASDLSPMQEEYEDTQGEDERFSTKRLRKMIEQSDPATLKSKSTDLQAPPTQEETPSIYKNPSYVQDRKGQAGNSSADGKTDITPSTGTRDRITPSTGTRDSSTPSTGTRNLDTPTAADASRVTSPPKGIAPDGSGASATEPRKSPSINEKLPAPPMPSQSPTSARRASASSNGASQDDDLAQSTIDQWRQTSTPAIQQGAPSDSSTDKLDKTAGVDRREQPHTPNKTLTEQSDESARQTPPADTRRTSASTPPAPLQAPASDGRSVSRSLEGGITDARRENEAVTNLRDQPLNQAPPPPSFADRRNMKTGIDEASQTSMVAPDEQPGGRAPKNSVNKPISSKDNGSQTKETVYYRSSETSSEMAPPVSEKSRGQQKMQSDKSGISPQDNGKQGSEAAFLTNADQNSGKNPGQALKESQKQTIPDTQQVKNNRSNSTSDGSSKPTQQFDGNEGDAPEPPRVS